MNSLQAAVISAVQLVAVGNLTAIERERYPKQNDNNNNYYYYCYYY